VDRKQVQLTEVGPRDGLQNEKGVIPLEAKIAFIDALSETGLTEIEAGAFVSPKAVPQMADSAAVFEGIKRKEGVRYSALVPNEKGLDAALEAEVDKIAVFTAASETFNQRNINASIAESLERFKPVAARAKQARLPVRAYVSTAFFCPFEGRVAPEKVCALVDRLNVLGCDEVSIGDTIGRAAPDDVRRLLDQLLTRLAPSRLVLHFHDTYGLAVANALAAWSEFGIYRFDSSAGGLGGCPYAPGASGNVGTEDLLFAFEASGGTAGVDLELLRAAALALQPVLGRPLASHLSRIERKPHV
jgi:hydroxymethylglutaryl-CoA lyase